MVAVCLTENDLYNLHSLPNQRSPKVFEPIFSKLCNTTYSFIGNRNSEVVLSEFFFELPLTEIKDNPPFF